MRTILYLLLCCFFIACDNTPKTPTTPQAPVPPEVQALNEKITADPNNAELYYQRALVYRALDMDSIALLDLHKTVSLDSTKSKYYSAIGDVFFDKKDIPGSVQWFQKAIAIDPQDETAHLKIASMFLFSREYDQALVEINGVLQRNVYNAEAYFLKGLVYKEMDEPERAITAFQAAVQMEPKYFDGYIQLGLLYTKKKNPLALQYFDNAIRVDSMNMEGHYAKAMYHQSQGQYAEAKKVFKQALATNRNYAEGHYNIGWMLLQQDSTEKAQREFERVIVLDPDNARAYYNHGLCHEIMGNNQKAAEDYEQALVFDASFDLPKEGLKRVKKK